MATQPLHASIFQDTLLDLAGLVGVEVRTARASDTDFLRKLHHAAYRDVVSRQFGGWDEEAQARWFQHGLHQADFFVLEHDKQLIGAVGLASTAETLQLAEFQLLPAWQGRGLGSAVMQHVLRGAAAHQLRVELRVLHQNRARILYERLGFRLLTQDATHVFMTWRADK